jgi:hypothetical protein
MHRDMMARASGVILRRYVQFDGGLGTALTVFFVVFAVVSVLYLVRTANGLKVLLRRR